MMHSPTASMMTGPTISTMPNRFSRPVINVDIPTVSFGEVMVNQNGSLHMDTPVGTLPDRSQRKSTDTIPARSSIHPSLTRADSLGMSSFVQSASGGRYIGNYDEGTEESSSEYARSSSHLTEMVQSDTEGAFSSSDTNAFETERQGTSSFGLGTPTSLQFHSPQEQYYGGVMLISRSEAPPHLHIAPVEQQDMRSDTSSPIFSPPFLSAQSDAFMGRRAYDVPVSAVPATDSDSGRSRKGSKLSVGSGGSATSGMSGTTTTSAGGGGFRGGLKTVKDSLLGIGGGPNGGRKKSAGGHSALSSPTSGSTTPRPMRHPQQQGIIDVSGSPSDWNYNAGVGILSPPLTTATDRFNMTRRSPNGSSPPAGSGFGRMASPFAYMQKITGSQARVHSNSSSATASSSSHDYNWAAFGQPSAGRGASSAVGLGSPFGRPGHLGGGRSVDVDPPFRQNTRWPNARRSRSIDGLGG